MRISNQTLNQAALRNLRSQLEGLNRAQVESATGRKIRTVSDQPLDASEVMRMEGQARDIKQFKRNATAATTRLSTEDAVLKSLQTLLGQAKSLVQASTTSSPSDPARLQALTEVGQLFDQVVSLGNSRVGDEFMFGGAVTDRPPFLPDGTYVGNATVRQAQIDDSTTIATNHTGNTIIQSVLAALNGFKTALSTGTAAQVQASFDTLEAARQQALQGETEIGVRLSEVKEVVAALGARSTALLDRRDAVRNADPAESAFKVVSAQSALERAYAVVGRVLSTSILDFLR